MKLETLKSGYHLAKESGYEKPKRVLRPIQVAPAIETAASRAGRLTSLGSVALGVVTVGKTMVEAWGLHQPISPETTIMYGAEVALAVSGLLLWIHTRLPGEATHSVLPEGYYDDIITARARDEMMPDIEVPAV
jgi:hypothetical protein